MGQHPTDDLAKINTDRDKHKAPHYWGAFFYDFFEIRQGLTTMILFQQNRFDGLELGGGGKLAEVDAGGGIGGVPGEGVVSGLLDAVKERGYFLSQDVVYVYVNL